MTTRLLRSRRIARRAAPRLLRAHVFGDAGIFSRPPKARKGGVMAQRRKRESKDLMAKLADAGEEAIQRLSEAPGGRKVLDAVSGLRDRIDELQKRVRSLGELEKRVKDLEKKVADLSKPRTRRTTTARKTTGTARRRTSSRTPKK